MNPEESQLLIMLYATVTEPTGWQRLMKRCAALPPLSRRALDVSLAPHLKQCRSMIEREESIRRQSSLLQSMADALPLPVILIDEQGAVLAQNRHADAFVCESNMEWWTRDHLGHIKLVQQDFADGLLQDLGDSPVVIRAGYSDSTDSHHAWLVPLPDGRWPRPSLYALIPSHFAHQSTSLQSTANAEALQSALLVSPAESRLILELLSGNSLAASASRLGIAYQTARTQLKSVFTKTACHRQSEVVMRALQVLWQRPAPAAPLPPNLAHGKFRLIEAQDKRQIGIDIHGNEDHYPVFFYKNLTGNCLAHLSSEQLDRFETCLIVIDRPGLGSSSPLADRSLRSTVTDLETVADALGYERFSVLGEGLGGRFALASAVTFTERIDRTGCLDSWSPLQEKNSPLGKLVSQMAQLSYQAPRLLQYLLEQAVRGFAAAPATHLPWILGGSNASGDSYDIDEGSEAAIDFQSFRQLIGHHPQGLAAELFLLAKDWGFCLSSVQCPTHVWHVQRHSLASRAHSLHLLENLPQAYSHDLSQNHEYPDVKAWDNILAFMNPTLMTPLPLLNSEPKAPAIR